MIQFAYVTLVHPTALPPIPPVAEPVDAPDIVSSVADLVPALPPPPPEPTVELVQLPAIVHKIHDDKTADLTIFSSEAFVLHNGGLACFFRARVPLDVTKSKAPSYQLVETHAVVDAVFEERESAPAPAPLAKGPVAAPTIVHSPPDGKRRVFGKGQAAKNPSTRSGSIRRFESASVSAGKGQASPEQILRSVGEPKASLPGQQPRRVFMKGKGEVTSQRQKQAIEAARADMPIDAERDPMGAIASMLDNDPDDDVPTEGEVPAPAPAPLPAAPAPRALPRANTNGRATTGGQPL